jgi:hypothetical protein
MSTALTQNRLVELMRDEAQASKRTNEAHTAWNEAKQAAETAKKKYNSLSMEYHKFADRTTLEIRRLRAATRQMEGLTE